MAGTEPDKVTREIEELLERLDNFVPEERLATKIRDRRRRPRAASSGPSFVESIGARLRRFTLGQVMLAGLALLLLAWLFDEALGGWARWVQIGGLLMIGAAFVMSLRSRRGTSSTLGGKVQKRWRGQIIEYGEPTTSDRVRGWFRRRR